MRLTEQQLKTRQKGTTKEPKKPKYRNKKVTYDGIKFDSQRECERYKQLILMRKQDLIRNLVVQPRFDLIESVKFAKDNRAKPAIQYIADFSYYDVKAGRNVVEDVKSKITAKNPVYRMKKHMMLKIHGLEITEIL